MARVGVVGQNSFTSAVSLYPGVVLIGRWPSSRFCHSGILIVDIIFTCFSGLVLLCMTKLPWK
ncbi:hypothetical protein BDV24DRAFT_129342 [Aspergillus arachidicola]|uniref:Uncharacterized protein n=1 Tax=Aspergillus arachidicola TaxID=656916 RepID=A0A5N6YJ24_9EURO|nr:hypothetical protein BDV24DRAFT_129342 [Aspergillus arachidicola]